MIIYLPDNLKKYYVYYMFDKQICYFYEITTSFISDFIISDTIIDSNNTDLIFLNSNVIDEIKNFKEINIVRLNIIPLNEIDSINNQELLYLIKQYLLFL